MVLHELRVFHLAASHRSVPCTVETALLVRGMAGACTRGSDKRRGELLADRRFSKPLLLSAGSKLDPGDRSSHQIQSGWSACPMHRWRSPRGCSLAPALASVCEPAVPSASPHTQPPNGRFPSAQIPITSAGEQRLAGVTPRTDWLCLELESVGRAEVAAGLSMRIASEWIEDARTEHASIAAFARFTLELLAFAAPSELVAEATRATQDELAHARACFSIARRYDPCALGPAGLDMTGVTPSTSLHDAVRTAFLEGCVGETQAALIARHAADVTHDPVMREALARIADDETLRRVARSR